MKGVTNEVSCEMNIAFCKNESIERERGIHLRGDSAYDKEKEKTEESQRHKRNRKGSVIVTIFKRIEYRLKLSR